MKGKLMNKLRIISDIHLEFSQGKYDFPEMENENEQILIIAGDLAPVNKHYIGGFIDSVVPRFKKVVMIAGNHEYYYKGSILTSNGIFDTLMNKYDNFHFLQNTMLMIDDLIIMGCTLWTNMNDHDPRSMDNARYGMNDFVHIKYGKKPYTVANWLAENQSSRDFLWDSLEAFNDDDRKKIVITHHLPSDQSITDQFYYTRGQQHKFAYCSDDMEEWLEMADIWIHGHVHNSIDYVQNDCRVISNPRGYKHSEENGGFNPNLTIDV